MSQNDFERLSSLNVLIVGVGGLGGNVANGLVRLGVKQFKLVDYDRFDLSNLNRQLFSNIDNVGKYKVEVVKNELLKIHPKCMIETSILNIKNIKDTDLSEFDYIIDAVDDIETKVFLSKLAAKLEIPLLHGACAGWYGQVGWILPGNQLLQELYENVAMGMEKELMNPSFTPSAVASFMVAEFLKMIQHSNETTINELLLIDVRNNSLLKTGGKQHD
ncbi:MAG: ThiF family adenylyltransferase [Firmicutes bacterium]|nr:ThiF family adenylyltransferase [Bacillota bacterium]